MTFDIIILSYSKTEKHRKITEDCIKSLKEAKNKVAVNIIVLESYDKDVRFDGVKNVFYQQPKFCYNASMNEGYRYATSDYIFFCNNDLIFNDGWADNCYYAFSMGYDSISPYCPTTHPGFARQGDYLAVGYQVGFHIAGWCIGVKRDMFERIGKFNTAVDFWFSDNIYAEQIKLQGVKHALVCNSLVRHLNHGSQTLRSLDEREKHWLTTQQRKKYTKEVRRLWDAKGKAVLR